MPWQQLIADVAGEINPETGLMAYREVCFTSPRQGGKTTLILAVEGERCVVWESPQRVIYTAQTGSDARDKLLEDQVPLLEAHLGKHIRRVYKAKGEESVSFKNGSKIQLTASSKQSGHGATIDLGVLDEVWADEDNRREQSLVPMMNTRPNAQLFICSTQGTDASVYLNRKTERGRAAAKEDRGSGVAYFEWSIPLDADIENPEIWWEYMPALGWTISEAAVAHALETMDEAEWRRAYGNQPTKGEAERIIPAVLWDSVIDPSAEVNRDQRRPSYGVDVLPDRSAAAIGASDGVSVELVDHRPGTGWIVERMRSLTEKYGGIAVIDGGGPAASIADDLEAANIKVKRLTNTEVAAACARFYDAVADQRIRVRPSQSLDDAVAAVARRPVGDRFVWARSTSLADITPLFAVTLAFGAAPDKELIPMVSFT
jgi:hypothetical protein